MLSSSLPVSLLPSTAVLSSIPIMREPVKTSVELPKLRIPVDAARCHRDIGHAYDNTYRKGFIFGSYSAPPVFVKKEEAQSVVMQSPHNLTMLSPSSPSTFFTQPEIAKLGLAPLLEAADQVRPSIAETLPPLYGRNRSLKRELALIPTDSDTTHLAAGYSRDTLVASKRARISLDVKINVQASNSTLGAYPHQAKIYPFIPQQHHLQRLYHQQNEQYAASYLPIVEARSTSMAKLRLPGVCGRPAYLGVSVWEIVLNTGKFPTELCLNENRIGGEASPTTLSDLYEIRCSSEDVMHSEARSEQDQWSIDEAQTIALIPTVKSEEKVHPCSLSTRKFAAKTRQCKTLRNSKNPSCLLCMSPRDPIGPEHEPVALHNESFNALSLKPIMNHDFSASPLSDVHDVVFTTIPKSNIIRQSPGCKSVSSTKKSTQRVLKRSDYSQHGMVRSGRWSVEEENYAKAMIEAFKAGYLPLHGNVSLRKFLSEVLVCHPMRISKKFVGYVRKYHWYRIAAGRCDLEAKRQVLYQLSHLERVFWTSLQQNSNLPSVLQCDDSPDVCD